MNNSIKLLTISDTQCLESGGKAAGLHSLAQASLNVPPAFVLTGNPGVSEAALISRAWTELNCKTVAARSSASDEDGKNWSAAGQYESILDISSEEALVKAVADCTASLNNIRASHYRQEHGGSSEGPRMNVIIQKMISARFAGVFFTDNPLNSSREEMILESVQGAGEELVSGRKAAVRIHLNKKGDILSTENPEPQEYPSEQQIARIAREALLFAEKEGCPQDLEWCIDDEGILYWLQSRPITSEDIPSAEEFDYMIQSEDEIFTRCNIGEMIPGAVTPLTRDCFAPSIEHAMRVLYKSSGGIHKGNKNRPFVVSFSNHLIFNFTSIYGMAGRIAGASKENIEMNILGKTIEDPLPHPVAPMPQQIFNAMKYFSTMGKHKRFLKKLSRLKDSVRFSGSNDPHQAVDEWISKLPMMDEGYALHMLISGHSGFANSLLTNILERSNPDLEVNDSLLSHLLSRVEGVESAQAVADLDNICDELFQSAANKDFVRSSDVKAVLKWLISSEDKAADMYRAFMLRHGHRCIREAEFRSRGWEEEPEQIISNLREMLKIKENGMIRKDLPPFPLESFLSGVPKGSARNSVAWALKKSRSAVREREMSKSHSIRIQYLFKKEIRRIASVMYEAGIIPDDDLIYFFTKEELKGLFKDDPQALIKKAEIRCRLLQEQSLCELPEIWRGEVPPASEKEDYDPSKMITGTPVSVGKIRGKVRIVKTAADAGRLEQGEIMVAPLTDIGWTPYYSIAGGMITEIGSALSHGSVIAREYGLPLVTNINSATQIFTDGTEIEIDGREGTVRILDAV
jgi:phosphohistidine swiveling domain-containing protein